MNLYHGTMVVYPATLKITTAHYDVVRVRWTGWNLWPVNRTADLRFRGVGQIGQTKTPPGAGKGTLTTDPVVTTAVD